MKQRMTDVTFNEELTLLDVVRLLRTRVLWIAIWGLIAAAATGIFTKCFIAPTYSSYTSMYVYTTLPAESYGSITNSDLVAAESLASTYQQILQSNTVLASVCDFVDKNWDGDKLTAGELEDLITVSTISDTQLLKIEVSTKNPKLSETIASAFAAVGPTEIVRVTKAGGVEIVDYAQFPEKADGPSLVKNTVLGMMVGILISAIYFFVRGIYDTTIYTENDLTAFMDVAIIGVIPEISQSGNTKRSVWVMEEGVGKVNG